MLTPWSCSQRNMGELLEPTNMQKGFMRATCRGAGGQGVGKNGGGDGWQGGHCQCVGVGHCGRHTVGAPHSAVGCLVRR